MGEGKGAYLASKRDQVVLTERVDLDVLYYHQLVVIFVEDCAVDDIPQILLVAFCEPHHRFCIPLRCPV